MPLHCCAQKTSFDLRSRKILHVNDQSRAACTGASTDRRRLSTVCLYNELAVVRTQCTRPRTPTHAEAVRSATATGGVHLGAVRQRPPAVCIRTQFFRLQPAGTRKPTPVCLRCCPPALMFKGSQQTSSRGVAGACSRTGSPTAATHTALRLVLKVLDAGVLFRLPFRLTAGVNLKPRAGYPPPIQSGCSILAQPLVARR